MTIRLAEVAGEGAQPDEVHLELAQPHFGRHVQGGERLLGNDASLAKAVAGLEALHAGLDVGIEDGRGACLRIKVARPDKAAAQRHDRGPVRADFQRRVRHRRPAATGDDPLILLDGIFGRSQRLLREDRRRRARHGQARVRVIALRPFRLLAEETAGRSEDCGGRDAYRRGAEAAKEATPGERRGSFDHQGLHTVTRTRIGPPFSCVVPLAANLRRTSRMRGGRGSLDAEFSA